MTLEGLTLAIIASIVSLILALLGALKLYLPKLIASSVKKTQAASELEIKEKSLEVDARTEDVNQRRIQSALLVKMIEKDDQQEERIAALEAQLKTQREQQAIKDQDSAKEIESLNKGIGELARRLTEAEQERAKALIERDNARKERDEQNRKLEEFRNSVNRQIEERLAIATAELNTRLAEKDRQIKNLQAEIDVLRASMPKPDVLPTPQKSDAA